MKKTTTVEINGEATVAGLLKAINQAKIPSNASFTMVRTPQEEYMLFEWTENI